MKWSKEELMASKNSTIAFEEEIVFEPETFARLHQLRGLRDIKVSGTIQYEAHSDLATCDFEVEGVMIVPCAITNEDVDYPFQTDDCRLFAFHKVAKDSDIVEAKGDIVELLPIIFQTIIVEIPLKVVKEGVKEYPKGEGWEALSEEEYERRKQNTLDPRLAKLREYKPEEE